MKKIFILSILMPCILFCQSDIHEFYQYDTTITSINLPIDLANFSPDAYNMQIDDSLLFIYSISYVEDTMKFFQINLNSKKVDSILLVHKKISDKIKTPFLNFISINKKYICIFSSYSNLLVYDRDNKNKIIVDTTFLGCSYMNGKLINDNLYLYMNYNKHPKECLNNTRFSIFSINQKELKYDTFMINPFIEFTHFSPSKFVTIHPKGIFFWTNSAQPYIYSISDKNKNEKYSIKMDTTCLMNLNFLKEFYKNQQVDAKLVIAFLSPFEDTVSRIEQIDFINDSIFHLIKIPCDNKNKKRLRLHDFYTYNKSKMIPFQLNIHEERLDENIIITKYNFPLLTSETMMSNKLFSNQFYIILSPMTNTSLLGKTKKQYDELLEKLFEKQNETSFVYGLTIFKINPK